MHLDDKHVYRVGSHSESRNDLPAGDDELDKFIATARKRTEPWLRAFISVGVKSILASMPIIGLYAIGGASLVPKGNSMRSAYLHTR
ncbi:hypothetical protein C7441_10919 [Pseudaminobacter salicylatoxidans]|uniref:Uncharacterized protein n=1 Tax=Pseudaminobacter salicylatoxidans TaxID=93369 RepID=A0A316C1C4_PSESE|nr:hypothetical protein [Pseudaminobacter salicylatoxidans]PWJ82253.1 hypothetical protein C7441_10919 [Pseudaminobacter salicylatoxidans]